jgi:predicted dehydrogenase
LAKSITWGIIGLGGIAARFAGSLLAAPDAQIGAVLSRDKAKADRFAAGCGARPHSDMDAFLSDPTIDIVYIASPHTAHMSQAIACLQRGKSVLIEKPIAATAADAAAIAEAAGIAGRFAMEAMWTRFLPATREAKRLGDTGAIGALKGFQANLSFAQVEDPASRLFDPALGGGSLLDLGVYPISMAVHFLGVPKSVSGHVIRASTGVDRQASLVLDHGNALSTISCGLDAEGPNDGVLMGEMGRIRLQRPLYAPAALLVSSSVRATRIDPEAAPVPARTGAGRSSGWKQALRPARQTRFRPFPFTGDGFFHQIEEVHRCLRAGLTQSPLMPLSESVSVLRIIDEVLKS